MEAVFYLNETQQAATILQSIRSELTIAVRTALLQQAYDTDIQLSFGQIHINSKGSISQVSFNGSDVVDMDAFIVKQAFRIGDDCYFDIRATIKSNPDDFCYYPIQIGRKVFLTVLKSSPYFKRKYGPSIHADSFRVEYASKYLLVYRNDSVAPDVYYVGLFTPEATANTLLTKAGKSLGGKSYIYYCFMNSRPEMFLHLGQVQQDFVAYHPERNPGIYNFYKGTVISGIFKINKKTDANGKIKVKETSKKCLQLVIKMQFDTVDRFCELYEIDKFLLTAYLSGANTEVKYTNGNTVTPSRLEELLNLPFSLNADGLKDKNLLIKVNYEDIPV